MSFLDKIKDKLTPEPSNASIPTSASGGIGNRRVALGFEDDVSTLFILRLLIRRASRLPSASLCFSHFPTTLRNYVRSLERRP